MGGQLLLASVPILVFLFLLPSASPRTALGGQTGEESALLFTVDSGEDLGGGFDSIENEIGHSSDGSGLFVGSDVVRGSFHSLLYNECELERWRASLKIFSSQQRVLPADMLLCKMEKR